MPHRFLDNSSLQVSGDVIGRYAETVGKVRATAASLGHNQPGDPQKMAEVLIAFTDAAQSACRMPLDSDTADALEKRHRKDATILSG